MKDDKFSDQELEVAANTDIAVLIESFGYTVDRKNRWGVIKEASTLLTKKTIGSMTITKRCGATPFHSFSSICV